MLPKTTTTLLECLHDQANEQAWTRFDERYRPVIIGFARKLGHDEQDACEIAQNTIVEFVKCYRAGKYSRGRGRLSSWLTGIAQNIAADLRRSQARAPQRGESAMIDLSRQESIASAWEEERRSAILAQALEQLRRTSRADERVMRAFELTALRAVPTEVVARECSMTAAEVYVAKNRMTARLRAIVEEITAAYEEDE